MAVAVQTMAAAPSDPIGRARGLPVRWLFPGSVALTLALSAWLTRGPVGGDALTYARMAAAPGTFTASPWGYRLLTPWLVHLLGALLGLPVATGFWLLTVLALAGTATTLGVLCADLGLAARAQAAAAALFLCSFAATLDLWDARIIDPLAYLGTVLVLLLCWRRRFGPAGVALTLTTLDKEWGVLLIPVILALLWAARPLPPRTALAALLWGLAGPLAAYWLVRHWPGFGAHAYTGYYGRALIARYAGHNLASMPVDLCVAFGLLWLPAALGWRTAPPPLRRAAPPLLAAAALQIIFAEDGARLWAFAFPVVIPLALWRLRSLAPGRWALAVALLLAVSALMQGPLLGDPGSTNALPILHQTPDALRASGMLAAGATLAFAQRPPKRLRTGWPPSLSRSFRWRGRA